MLVSIDIDHISTNTPNQSHNRGQDQDLRTPDGGRVDIDARGQDQDQADIDALEVALTLVTEPGPVPDPDPDPILVPEGGVPGGGTLAHLRGDALPGEDAATIVPGTYIVYVGLKCCMDIN